jgi:muconolactone D-isomerase
MMFFFSVRFDHSGVPFDELWDEWEKEVDAAQTALEAGKIKNFYTVSGQRRVVGVLDVDSHEGARPYPDGRAPKWAHMLNFEEIVPIREYSDFADDVRKRWQQWGTADAQSGSSSSSMEG